ncbi:MAG: aquaporin, partial [Paludibacteraceae bacterium]|nr:aquaporin [Paludibacteraceae bacterium]
HRALHRLHPQLDPGGSPASGLFRSLRRLHHHSPVPHQPVFVQKPCAAAGFGGLAIGLTLTLIHLISIPLTNTSVNPARSISQAIFADSAYALPQLWLFIVAPLVGAALAGLLYRYLEKE